MSDLDRLRRDARAVFQAALAAVDPEEAVRRCVTLDGRTLRIDGQVIDLAGCRNIWVVGAGKAVAPMAKALEDLLGERISGGVLVVKDGHGLPLKRVQVREASHPVPDERGVQGTLEVLELAERAGANDLVICLISGGGSALLIAPTEGVTLADKQATTRSLLACGATIHEINTIRKHLSRAKGGRLAQAAYPARVVSLILSDVVGDDLDVIGSGPTVPDRSTYADTTAILKRYDIWERIPAAVRASIAEGESGQRPESPKPGAPAFALGSQVLVGTCLRALRAAADEADRRGYRSLILSSKAEGEAREVAKAFAAVGKEVRVSELPLPAPACILLGGETTVTLQGGGKGGRNQEFVLAGALALEGLDGVVLLAAGTDGTDGPTDAAGAIADGRTCAAAQSRGLDPHAYLKSNDSYHFFQALDDLVVTGPTRTNVMDIYMLLVGTTEAERSQER